MEIAFSFLEKKMVLEPSKTILISECVEFIKEMFELSSQQLKHNLRDLTLDSFGFT